MIANKLQLVENFATSGINNKTKILWQTDGDHKQRYDQLEDDAAVSEELT